MYTCILFKKGNLDRMSIQAYRRAHLPADQKSEDCLSMSKYLQEVIRLKGATSDEVLDLIRMYGRDTIQRLYIEGLHQGENEDKGEQSDEF